MSCPQASRHLGNKVRMQRQHVFATVFRCGRIYRNGRRRRIEGKTSRGEAGQFFAAQSSHVRKEIDRTYFTGITLDSNTTLSGRIEKSKDLIRRQRPALMADIDGRVGAFRAPRVDSPKVAWFSNTSCKNNPLLANNGCKFGAQSLLPFAAVSKTTARFRHQSPPRCGSHTRRQFAEFCEA